MLVTELPSAAWLSITADVALPAPWPRASCLFLHGFGDPADVALEGIFQSFKAILARVCNIYPDAFKP